MLKHSESGGFITIDERSTVRQEGMLEAYVKVCKNDIMIYLIETRLINFLRLRKLQKRWKTVEQNFNGKKMKKQETKSAKLDSDTSSLVD